MNLLRTPRGRRVLLTLLYALEGAPIGFVWWALPTLMRDRGVSLEAIASLVAALALPWALKFLWAPLVDRLRGPRWGRRAWIAAAQVAMVATLLPLAWLDLVEDLALVRLLLLAHATAAATQDVAIDALAVATLDEAERGRANGWMQAGMLGARVAFGGLVLGLAGDGSHAGPVLAVAGFLALGLPLAALYRDETPPRSRDARAAWRAGLGRVLRRRATWLALAFAALGGAGYEAVGALCRPLLVDAGAEPADVATLLDLWVVLAMGLGALAGGRLADRHPRRGAVTIAGMAVAASVLLFSATLHTEVSPALLSAAAAGVYLALGGFTATTYALFMDLTDPEVGATQFSAYMGATNFCEVWSVRSAGWLVGSIGASSTFTALALIGLLALALVPFLHRHHTAPGLPDAPTR